MLLKGTKRKKLFLAESEDFNPQVLALLNKYFEVTIPEDETWDLKTVLRAYDIFWFRLAYQIDGRVLDSRTTCQYLVTPVTGINHIDEALCAEYGIEIICLRGEYNFLREVRATAEMTVGLAIALMRHIIPARKDVVSGHWRRDLFRGEELYKKKAGIIGYGRLGRIVAGYFKAMGMEVSAYDPYREIKDEGIVVYEDMHHLLRQADLVSIHVSLTSESAYFFDTAAFEAMKEGSYLINTSRGELLEEAALLAALRSGKLAGAALDVLADEHSIDKNHPLIQYAENHPNLLIVPHIGGNTYESFEKTERFIAEKLIRKLADVDT